jgi:ABC-type polysaccharide/polyol phosphate export permease
VVRIPPVLAGLDVGADHRDRAFQRRNKRLGKRDVRRCPGTELVEEPMRAALVTTQAVVPTGGVGIATIMSPTATLLGFGLLVKGCFARNFLRKPIHAVWNQILLPTAVICFVALLETGTTARTAWPMIATAGAVWLLFANCVNYGGMVLSQERWLLRQPVVPPWLLVAAAAVVPIGFFAVHLLLIRIALSVGSFPRGEMSVEILVAGGIAVTFGLGSGIIASRLTGFRPNFAAALPRLLLASLVLTPVFYRPSALDGFKDAWCLVNPLCVASELARGGISFPSEALPPHAMMVACAVSGAVLCWGLLTLSVSSPPFADEHV